MKMKTFITIIAVAIILSVGLYLGLGSIELNVGASPGPDHYNKQIFQAGHVDGGIFLEYPSLGETNTDNLINEELTAYDVCNAGTINWDSATGSASLWLPSGASLINECLGGNQGRQVVWIGNSSGTPFTLVATTGIELMSTIAASATADVLSDATEVIRLELKVASSVAGTVEAYITKFNDAD